MLGCSSTRSSFTLVGRVLQQRHCRARTRASLSTKLGEAAASTMANQQSDATPSQGVPAPLFRQLFDAESSTYTYLLADATTREAVLIDPVLEQVDRDLAIIEELGLKLLYGINTHCHADHITGTGAIKAKQPHVKSVISRAAGAKADILLEPGDLITFGDHQLKAIPTPGHTSGCMSLYAGSRGGMVFTGDTLLIRGCGRTDFQQGSSELLYKSVHERLFTLPDDTAVYPAHDYKGRTSSSIWEEKRHNPRLTKSLDEFVGLMANLQLAYPKKMDVSVPANLQCGILDP